MSSKATDIEKLEDSPHLLDLLIQMEDVLDSLDVYVFKNWIDGEIVEGPTVRRYWLDLTLKYPYKKMPDPRAGLRLLKHGIRIDFQQAHMDARGKPVEVEEGKAKDKSEDNDGEKVWLIRISIPRRLMSEMNAGELDFYDDEVDMEDVEDAQDSGMNDESGYGEDATNGEAGPTPDDPNADPNAPPADMPPAQPAGGKGGF